MSTPTRLSSFAPRRIQPAGYTKADLIKRYCIRAGSAEVHVPDFERQLEQIKLKLDVDWPHTLAFCVFHAGASMNYLVLCWWGNTNELFHSVWVQRSRGWVSDPLQFSFCVYDMEVMQFERELLIRLSPNLEGSSAPSDSQSDNSTSGANLCAAEHYRKTFLPQGEYPKLA